MAVQAATVENKTQPRIEGMTLQVKKLEQQPKTGGDVVLAGISLHIEPGELVVISGPGKSTLLQTMAGIKPPKDGQVLLNTASLYGNLRLLRETIGYVPPETSLHETLTPREILRYEAGLRLKGLNGKQAAERVQAILEVTGLQGVANRRLTHLPAYEKRLTSIAVELLAQPRVLLVDETAQTLSPVEAGKINSLLRSLAALGMTVVQASDLARCGAQADKIAVLAPDGTLAWFGPAPEALEYFRELHPSAENLNSYFNLENALEVPSITQAAGGKSWGDAFQKQPYCEKYVDAPLSGKRSDLLLEDRPLNRFRGKDGENALPPKRAQPGVFKKLFTLIGRNFVTTARARRFTLILLLPVLLALTDLLISSPGMNDPLTGDATRLPVVLGALIFLNMLTAALLFQNEIHQERSIIGRERRTLTLALPYALSKVWWVGLFAVYQGVVWAVVHFVAEGLHSGLLALGGYTITFILVAFIGGCLGLIASALGRTTLAVTSLALLFILPQLLLSGSIIPLPHMAYPARLLSWATPARYAFGSLLTLSGYGRDVVADACWQMPEAQRAALTDADKQSCACMGENVFSRCNFPGIHSSFNYVIEQARPIQPTPDPILSSPPVQPLVQPGQTLEEYEQAVTDYTLQLESYLATEDAFNSSLRRYTAVVEDWQRQRSLAIGTAEGIIADALEHYGHAFNVSFISYWFILSAFSLALIVLLVMVIPK